MRASSLQKLYWIGPISENVILRVISVVSAGHNHFWILDDVTNMDVVVGPRGNSLLYSSPSDFVPELYPMKPCKIIEEKHLHTKLMAIVITRQKEEESGGGACYEGLDRGITSL